MKMIIALAALVAVAVAAPQYDNVQLVAETLHDNIGLTDGYRYGYQLSDGSTKEEQASFRPATDEEGRPTQAIVVQGSYSFIGNDGQQYTVQYTADESGFHPTGAHLPVAPVAQF